MSTYLSSCLSIYLAVYLSFFLSFYPSIHPSIYLSNLSIHPSIHLSISFFDSSTSKSGRRPSVFNTFDLRMCFALQLRALFGDLNFQEMLRAWGAFTILTSKRSSHHNDVHFPTTDFQKCSKNGVLSTFWLRHVLRATAACTFSTSQRPKVLRTWGVLSIMTSKCAWRHSRVQFLISPPTRWLCTHRFSEPTFRLSGATNWKNTMFGDISTFSHALIFLLLLLSLLTPSLLWPLSPLLLHLSISRKFDF